MKKFIVIFCLILSSKISAIECDPKVGLVSPISVCSQADPCFDAVAIDDQGVLRTGLTLTNASNLPICKTNAKEANKRQLFNDGEPLSWVDNSGISRFACISRKQTTGRMPLILFFHGAAGSASDVYNYTSLRSKAEYFSLANNIGNKGFILVSIQGRNLHWPNGRKNSTHHDYFHRSMVSESTNPDVQFADYVVDMLVSQGRADPRRIYVMGWSNGAAFAQFYAIARYRTPTPGKNYIAAGAAYAFGDPFNTTTYDQTPSCALNPYPKSNVPLFLINRDCDALTCCNDKQSKWFSAPPGNTANNWIELLAQLVQNKNIKFQIINRHGISVSHCRNVKLFCSKLTGLLNHVHWPDGISDGGHMDWELEMLNFLAEHYR